MKSARTRNTSPEAATEILLYLLGHADQSFSKAELLRALRLTCYNVDSFLRWAASVKLPSAERLVLRHGTAMGRERFQGNRAAIRAYLATLAGTPDLFSDPGDGPSPPQG